MLASFMGPGVIWVVKTEELSCSASCVGCCPRYTFLPAVGGKAMGGRAGTFISTFLVHTQVGTASILLAALINVWRRKRERVHN